ncbi:MAG TPA: hypothetical protein DHN29_12550 [Cytophagales bacterium]|nr:hypothetical protein [Cytophagales bacterium]
MPQVSAKQTRIDHAKKSAPKVPGDTCPSINYVQDILEQVSARTSDEWADKQIEVANGVLEYIREANEELRLSSHYWYEKFKGAV